MRDTNFFRACGEALFGGTWQNELARSLGMSLQSGGIRKMASGSLAVSPRTWTWLALPMRQRGMVLQALADRQGPRLLSVAAQPEIMGRDMGRLRGGCRAGPCHLPSAVRTRYRAEAELPGMCEPFGARDALVTLGEGFAADRKVRRNTT